jgi:hypothetical protein
MLSAVLAETDARSRAKQFLVFPDLQELLPAKTVRLIDFRILIEFESGLIGSFRTARRQIPGPTEFLDLEYVLQGMSEKYQTAGYASQIAVDVYGLDVEILDYRFQHISDWSTEQHLAAALANLAGSHANIMERRNSLQDSARERLQLGLAGFMSRLDPDILSRLESPVTFVPSHYNYFAAGNPTLRRNRLQGNMVFGLVFRNFTDHTPPNILLSALTRAVDAGTSLISVLCQREKVSPAVAKLILKCPTEVFIEPWRNDIRFMGQLLSMLEPAFRPTSVGEWVALHGCAKALKLALHLDWTGPVFKCWLNDAAQAKYALWTDDQERDLVCMIIVEMTQSVADLVANAKRANGDRDAVRANVRDAVWEYLGQKRLGTVLDMAKAWQRSFEREQEKLVSEKLVTSGIRWLSVVESFSTPTRLVTPLVTPEDLYFEGVAMRHCVATYTRMCAKGEVQIWSIRTHDNKRCTTLATWFLDDDGKVVRVMQHHALGNGPADPESTAAAKLLIEHMTSDEQDFSKFHVWRKARQHVAEDFNVQALTYQISSLAVKASVPDLLEVGMRCLKVR